MGPKETPVIPLVGLSSAQKFFQTILIWLRVFMIICYHWSQNSRKTCCTLYVEDRVYLSQVRQQQTHLQFSPLLVWYTNWSKELKETVYLLMNKEWCMTLFSWWGTWLRTLTVLFSVFLSLMLNDFRYQNLGADILAQLEGLGYLIAL